MPRQATEEEIKKVQLAASILGLWKKKGQLGLPADMAVGMLTSFSVEELEEHLRQLKEEEIG